MPKNKSILKLSSQEAENFLLKQDSYCNFNLPPYIKFEPLLDAINKIIKNNNYKFECIKSKNPNNFDDVNYKLFNNKNGKYDWRLLELINPICKEVDKIYKIEWLNNKKLKNAINKYPIICKKDIDEIAEYTNVDEISIFENHSL